MNIQHTYQPPPAAPVNIRYADEYLMIVEKPEGLLSVPGRGPDKQDCLMSRIQQQAPEALNVHRLDMDTSGLMLIARTPAIQRQLSHLFQTQAVDKHYTAVVAGLFESKSGTIDLPLICDWPNRPRQIVDHANGKPAQTLYKVIAQDKNNQTSRVTLTPKTGRTHQLRVHMQSLGHSVLGDRLYADKQDFLKANRLLLHASKISFKHPVSGQVISVSSKPSF